jgi:hypothetical protein
MPSTPSLTLSGLNDDHIYQMLGLTPPEKTQDGPVTTAPQPGPIDPRKSPAAPVPVDPAIHKQVTDARLSRPISPMIPKPMTRLDSMAPPSVEGAKISDYPSSNGQPLPPIDPMAHGQTGPRLLDNTEPPNIDGGAPSSFPDSFGQPKPPYDPPKFGTPPWNQEVANNPGQPSLGMIDPLNAKNQPYDKTNNPTGHKSWGDLGKLGKLGRVALTAGNIGGDILAPGTMKNIPGTQLNNEKELQNREDQYDKSAVAEKDRAEADKDKVLAKDKYDFHTTDSNGDVWGTPRGGGQPVNLGPIGALTPARENKNVIDAFQKDPTNPANISKVEEIKETWANPVPLTGTIEHGKPVFDSKAPQILARYNNVTGRWQQMGDVKQGAEGKGTYHMVPDADGKNEQLMYFPPDNPTKGQPIGGKNPIGSLQILNDSTTNEPIGTFNTKTGQFSSITGETAPDKPAGAMNPSGARLAQTQANAFNKDYEVPAQITERGYQMATQAKQSYDSGDSKTGAATMMLLAQHIGSTFGQIKGTRQNKDLINEHKDAIGIEDRLQRFAANITKGDQLSKTQVDEFYKLLSTYRNYTWQMNAQEAQRRHQPIDFLPHDVQIGVRDPKTNKVHSIPGTDINAAIEAGGIIEK